MKSVIQLAVVGLGSGFQVAKDVLGESTVRLTAICDRNPEKVADALKYLSEHGYEDVESFFEFGEMLLQGDFDAIFIAPAVFPLKKRNYFRKNY